MKPAELFLTGVLALSTAGVALAATAPAAPAAAPAAAATPGPAAQPSPQMLELAKKVAAAEGDTGMVRDATGASPFDPPITLPENPAPAVKDKYELYKSVFQEVSQQAAATNRAETARAYATTYTQEELTGLLAFLTSPAGKGVLAKQDAVKRRMFAFAMTTNAKIAGDAMTRYCAKTTCTAAERASGRPALAAGDSVVIRP